VTVIGPYTIVGCLAYPHVLHHANGGLLMNRRDSDKREGLTELGRPRHVNNQDLGAITPSKSPSSCLQALVS
jgi:hypothetical protein